MRELVEMQPVTTGKEYSARSSDGRFECSVTVKNGEIVYANWNHSGLVYDATSSFPHLGCMVSCLEEIYKINYAEFCKLLKDLDKSSKGFAQAKRIVEADIALLEQKLLQLKALI